MNKYNIRAIRNELDTYIRYVQWKKFRLRFQSLQSDLAQAVVEYRGNHSRTTSLHALCRCCSSVPLDILEAVLRVCPPHLVLQRSPTTPLAMALGHYHQVLNPQASLTRLLEALILHDTTTNKESLYIKDKAGDTPILQAVRQKQQHDIDWDVVRLLVQHDNDTKQTLLIPSKKKQRVPLWYVVASHQDKDDCPLLEYMLLQTYHALEIQQGRKGVDSALIDATCTHQHLDQTGTNSSGFFPNESVSSLSSGGVRQQDHMILLLQAVLACAHLLGSKNTMKIFSAFHLNESWEVCQWQQQRLQDSDGNTLLHHACRAVESSTFLEPLPASVYACGSCSLLQYLIDGYPQALFTSNAQGQLPLHLAIKAQKGWEFLRHLCFPQAVLRIKTKQQQVALHLALNHCPSNGYYSCKEIMELWNGYPEAVAIVDGKTGLFAFQLAAAVGVSAPEHPTHPTTSMKTSSTRSDEQQQAIEKDQLSLIYFFLRTSPEVIRQYG